MSFISVSLIPCSSVPDVFHVQGFVCSPDSCNVTTSPNLTPQSFGIQPKFISFVVPSSTRKTPSPAKPSKAKADSPEPLSPDEILSIARKANIPLFSGASANVPWFEVLFPSIPVPALTSDFKLPKDEFNSSFKDLTSRVKSAIKSEGKTPPPHLPREVASLIQEVILAAATKSNANKVPSRVIKRVQHLTPPEIKSTKKTTSSSPSKEKKASPSTKKPETPKIKEKLPSAAPVAPKQQKAPSKKAQAPATPAISKPSITSIPDVMKALHDHGSFYYAEDKTPTFQTLFPGTSQPRFTRRSGNVYIEKDHFLPLLKMRITSAHKVLRAKNLHVTKLPAAFMKYQTRLICRSVEQTKSTHAAARKLKKQKAKQPKTAKELEFVPDPTMANLASQSLQDQPEPDNSQVDNVRSLRDLRLLLESHLAEASSGVLPDPRVSQQLVSHPAIRTFYNPTPSVVQAGFKIFSVSLCSHSFGDQQASQPAVEYSVVSEGKSFRSYLPISPLLRVVSNRTGLGYESVLTGSV